MTNQVALNARTLMDPERQLGELMAKFADDPMGWVMLAFPWDTDPSIQMVKLPEPWASRYGMEWGPDQWFCEFLEELGEDIRKNGFDGKMPVPAIQKAVASGHGIGKSVGISIIALFIMSTRPWCKGTITANTADQLSAKTWAELGKWRKKCITGHWFEYTTGKGNMVMWERDHKEDWFVKGVTCREENSEAFAGQHAANSSSFYLFDEASAIPDKIWEVAEGGLTDGEPFWFAFGNPTRNTGRFFQCFHKLRNYWGCRKIDSRKVSITNKDKLEEWRKIYGEDSDFFKVRVMGEFPSSDLNQFIDTADVQAAQQREAVSHHYQPLIMGIDPAGGGGDKWVIRFRRGSDARSIKPIKMYNPDPMDFAALVAKHFQGSHHTMNQEVHTAFCDTGCGGWNLIKIMRKFGVNVVPVTFSNDSLREDCANKRAQMWADMRDHLKEDLAIDSDRQLHDW